MPGNERTCDLAALLGCLQVGDSLFPTGRYTLSYGLETFAAATNQRAAVLALQVDPCGFRRLFDSGCELHAHGVDHALDERRDLSG